MHESTPWITDSHSTHLVFSCRPLRNLGQGVLGRIHGTVHTPLLRTVLCNGSNTNLHYPFQTQVVGVGVGGGQVMPLQFRGNPAAPGRRVQPPDLLRAKEGKGVPGSTLHPGRTFPRISLKTISPVDAKPERRDNRESSQWHRHLGNPQV